MIFDDTVRLKVNTREVNPVYIHANAIVLSSVTTVTWTMHPSLRLEHQSIVSLATGWKVCHNNATVTRMKHTNQYDDGRTEVVNTPQGDSPLRTNPLYALLRLPRPKILGLQECLSFLYRTTFFPSSSFFVTRETLQLGFKCNTPHSCPIPSSIH